MHSDSSWIDLPEEKRPTALARSYYLKVPQYVNKRHPSILNVLIFEHLMLLNTSIKIFSSLRRFSIGLMVKTQRCGTHLPKTCQCE